MQSPLTVRRSKHYLFAKNMILVESVTWGISLVRVAGIRDMSEVVFDAIYNSARRAMIVPEMEITLCGGEPYASWA